ncbi:hypothetical protein WDU94_010762 [Cyamophila willieti]
MLKLLSKMAVPRTTEPLNGVNFQNWKFRMESLLSEYAGLECVQSKMSSKPNKQLDEKTVKRDAKVESTLLQARSNKYKILKLFAPNLELNQQEDCHDLGAIQPDLINTKLKLFAPNLELNQQEDCHDLGAVQPDLINTKLKLFAPNLELNQQEDCHDLGADQPDLINTKLKLFAPNLKLNRQEDCHDFLLYLFHGMQESYMKAIAGANKKILCFYICPAGPEYNSSSTPLYPLIQYENPASSAICARDAHGLSQTTMCQLVKKVSKKLAEGHVNYIKYSEHLAATK